MPPTCLLVNVVWGGRLKCGHRKEKACETVAKELDVSQPEVQCPRKVTGMGVGVAGRVAGDDETGKVAWSQIVKAPGNQDKEAGLEFRDNGKLIEGLSRKVTQSSLFLGR